MSAARSTRSAVPEVELVPCLLLRRGEVCLPGPNGPEVVRGSNHKPLDPFDVLDRVRAQHEKVYLVDLDGIEHGSPQLEYIQEFSREVDLWVDSGVATADAAIDILVAGAQRAVLSSANLRGPAELKRAWRLSTDWAFEVDVGPGGSFIASDRWTNRDPVEAATFARGIGISTVVVSPREADPDWALVGAVAHGGPTWVDGTFTQAEAAHLSTAGAAGGIYHIELLLAAPTAAPSPLTNTGPTRPRDDEE